MEKKYYLTDGSRKYEFDGTPISYNSGGYDGYLTPTLGNKVLFIYMYYDGDCNSLDYELADGWELICE